MPEIIITYKSSKTLEALKSFAGYFNFVISSPKSGLSKEFSIKGVSIIPADSSIETSDLQNVFTSKNINAKTLRNQAWQRRK